MPAIDLRQALNLSDDTGIFQHAVYHTPDANHGYCIDDNARAAIAAIQLFRLRGDDGQAMPLHRYITFLAYAWNNDRRVFRNFMSYDRRWLEDEGSQDSQARTLWALGLAATYAPNDSTRSLAVDLFNKGMDAIDRMDSLRSWAFTLIGLDAFLQSQPEHERANHYFAYCSERLASFYHGYATPEWPWWEEVVTYDNAKLCHAMLLAGRRLGKPALLELGLKSLAWLLDQQRSPEGHLAIIGNDGWLRRGQPRAQFDQQPLEAYALIHACLVAARLSDDPQWPRHAWMCFEWFTGRNDLGQSVHDPETGGCQDGLASYGMNRNQGAESTLAYLLSVLELHLFREQQLGHIKVSSPPTLGYAVVGERAGPTATGESPPLIEGLQWVANDESNLPHEQLRALLADPAVQVIHLATAPAEQAEQAIACLKAGKHVLAEPPVALTAAAMQQIMDAAAERDVRLGVNLTLRYASYAEPIRQLITSGLLGDVLRGQVTQCESDADRPADHWSWDEAISGGLFIQQGVPLIDLHRAWLGEATVLDAFRLRRPTETEQQLGLIDQAGATLRFGPQTTVNFYHSRHQSPLTASLEIRLIFERGHLTLCRSRQTTLQITAGLSETQIESLAQLFPQTQQTTLEAMPGQSTTRRHRTEPMDRCVRLEQVTPIAEPGREAEAALLRDFVGVIHHRHAPIRVTPDDARAAVVLAREADRIAHRLTP